MAKAERAPRSIRLRHPVTGSCGHRDYTQYNLTKYLATSTTGRMELIAHEQGHAHDLNDLCQGAPPSSLMSNGKGACSWGGALQAFQASDRTDVNSEYK